MKIKIALYLFICLWFQNCGFEKKEKIKPTTLFKKPETQVVEKRAINFEKLNITLIPSSENYTSVCQKIQKEKNEQDSLSHFFENALINQIIPFWYGTPWDFNGHTNIPNKGQIACGYLVSTTLKHMGFNLNRYRLAEQSPKHEALTLSLGMPLLEIAENSFKNSLAKMKSELSDGIYFIGLEESHVGFLLSSQAKLFKVFDGLFFCHFLQKNTCLTAVRIP